MPKEPIYTVSIATQAKVRDLFNQRDYPAAYQAVADDLKAQAAHGVAIDPNTLTWYSDAAQINDPNSKSFIHDFVRAYVSDYAQLTQQKPINDAQFQLVSNDLAYQVLGPIADNGSVLDFTVVGEKDTTTAVTKFARLGVPVDQYAWPAYADLASFPWLRNLKNATWLNNLTLVEQRNILLAANMAGQTALVKSRGKGVTPADILNWVSLDDKLRTIEGQLALHDVMKSALAIYGSLQQSAAALEGKSIVERVRHYAAQARADAAKKPVSPVMRLHRQLMEIHQQQHSYAPVPTQRLWPAKPAARGDEGAWAAPQPAGALNDGARSAETSLKRRMGEKLGKFRPEPFAAINGHGATVLQRAGGGPAGATEGLFELAEMAGEIGASPPGLGPGFFDAIGDSPVALAAGMAELGKTASGLPSMAPPMAPGAGAALGFTPYEGSVMREAGGVQAQPFAARAGGGVADAAAVPGVEFGTGAGVRGRALQKAVQEYFEIQARLPPSGATGFDPRLTPAWPGMQIPA